MSVNVQSSILEQRRPWHRRVGVLLCLVALVFSLFGHIEAAEARSFEAQPTVVAFDHFDDAADHGAGTTSHHCLHQGQCTLQAVLPSDKLPNVSGMTRTKPAADHLGMSRVISPHGHPPKTSFLQ